MLDVSTFTIKEHALKINTPISPSWFAQTIRDAPKYRDLQIDIAFWREAMNAFEDGKHLHAIHGFWAVIEDLFADGHTGKKQVLRTFKESARFRRTLTSALISFSKAGENLTQVKELFATRGHEYTIEGAMGFLYDIRGHLFHFSSRQAATKATPFNQRTFRPLALFMSSVVTSALIFEIMDINRREAGLPPESEPIP
jgi:hypothetical protein